MDPNELSAFADIYGMSTDALLGRQSSGTDTDTLWAISKLTSTAQKTAGELRSLYTRIDTDLGDLTYYGGGEIGSETADNVINKATKALTQLKYAEEALTELADQFPLPR